MPEAKFRIGVLYARELDRAAEAVLYLRDAAREHPDEEIREFARTELEALDQDSA